MANPRKWTADEIPDLSGRTYLVTGATSGLGLVTAIELAGHGGRVIVTGRNAERLRAATEEVAAAATHDPPESLSLDLASLESIHRAASEVSEIAPRIDVLVNNAGVMATPRGTTVDGFELQIGTNHLGHFALTGLLLPLIPHAEEAGRVVTVASLAHRNGRIDVTDLSFADRGYSPWVAYGQSKLANLLFTSELDRRATAAGWQLIAAAAHPGFAATNLFTAGPSWGRTSIGRLGNKLAETLVSQPAADGALPTLYAATASDVVSDDYYGPDGPFEIRGNPRKVGRSAAARNAETARELWERSEQLTGVVFDFA